MYLGREPGLTYIVIPYRRYVQRSVFYTYYVTKLLSLSHHYEIIAINHLFILIDRLIRGILVNIQVYEYSICHFYVQKKL